MTVEGLVLCQSEFVYPKSKSREVMERIQAQKRKAEQEAVEAEKRGRLSPPLVERCSPQTIESRTVVPTLPEPLEPLIEKLVEPTKIVKKKVRASSAGKTVCKTKKTGSVVSEKPKKKRTIKKTDRQISELMYDFNQEAVDRAEEEREINSSRMLEMNEAYDPLKDGVHLIPVPLGKEHFVQYAYKKMERFTLEEHVVIGKTVLANPSR